MGAFRKFYDKAHIFRAKYGSIDLALGRWTTTVGQNAPKSMRAHARESFALAKTFYFINLVEGVTFPSVIWVFAKSHNLTRSPMRAMWSLAILSFRFPEVWDRKGTESGCCQQTFKEYRHSKILVLILTCDNMHQQHGWQLFISNLNFDARTLAAPKSRPPLEKPPTCHLGTMQLLKACFGCLCLDKKTEPTYKTSPQAKRHTSYLSQPSQPLVV